MGFDGFPSKEGDIPALDEINKLKAVLEKCVETFCFYADPFNRKDDLGDDVRVPDFYGELNFGERAEVTLAAIDAVLGKNNE